VRLVYERWTHPVATEILSSQPGTELSRLELGRPAERGWALLEHAQFYQVPTRTDCASVPEGTQWLAGADLVARCGELLAVCSAGAGYDVVDVDACTKAGIIVCNNSGPGAEAVAEHALGFMLALAKRIVVADRMIREVAIRDRSALRGTELAGKTLGIVGLGQIGSRLVELCSPLHMTVLAFDPYLSAEEAVARGATKVELAELLARSDFVHLNCPLTEETDGLIGADQFAAMKPTAFFVSTARGRVHDEQALYDALSTQQIAGAALDVFHDEPPSPDSPLLGLDNVVATPHTAGITVEAVRAIAVATAEQWLTILAGKAPPRLVNPDAWPRYCDRFAKAFGFRPVASTR